MSYNLDVTIPGNITYLATGTIGVGTDTATQAVSIANGAGVKTTTLGSINTTSTTLINSGSGGITLDSTTGTDGDIKLDAGSNVVVSGNIITLTSSTGDINLDPPGGSKVDILGDMDISGDLDVAGTTTTTSTAITTLFLSDNYIHANTGYISDAPQRGGAAIRYDPTTLTTTIHANGFLGVVTVDLDTDPGFVATDVIAIDGANDLDNDGLYEVASITAGPAPFTLTIENPITAATEDFLKVAFVGADVGAFGTVTKVNLSVIRSKTDGEWEVGKGNQVGSYTYSDVSIVPTGGTAITEDILVRGSGSGLQGSAITVTDSKGLEITGGTLSVGANADDHAVTVGSVIGVAATTVQGGTSGVTLNSLGTISADADTDSHFTVDAANLLLSTTTSGDVNITSVGDVDIDGTNVQLNAVNINSLNQMTGLTHMDLIHTAVEADDHAVEIDCLAAGFGDVKALDIVYNTGALTALNEEECILVNIDETSATGGRIVAIEVLSTAESSAVVDALEVGVGVHPILHESGTFGDADTILDIAVDETISLSSGGGGAIGVFTNDNETMTVGDAAKFAEIEFIMGTVSSGAGIAPTFEFSTGVGTWGFFTPADGTNGMRNNGIVAYSVTDIPGWLVGTGSEFLIRITRTRNVISIPPVMDLVQIAATTEYSWLKDGAITANTFNGVTVETHAARHLPSGADPITTAAPSTDLTNTSTNAEGSAESFARSDHDHALDLGGFNFGDVSSSTGTSVDNRLALYDGTGGVTIKQSTAVLDTSGALTGIVSLSASGDITTTNGNVIIDTTDATAGQLRLEEPNGGFFTSFESPALAANVNYILPPDDGDASEVLQTNGSGTLTWVVQTGGGGSSVVATRDFEATDFLNPGSSADWKVNVLAPAITDPDNGAINVRAFDDSTDEGIGFHVYLPADAANVTIVATHRSATGTGTLNVDLELHVRPLNTDHASGAGWVTETFADFTELRIAMTANENWRSTKIIDDELLAAFNTTLVADTYYQFELTRDANDVTNDTHVGDWYLTNIHVEITS